MIYGSYLDLNPDVLAWYPLTVRKVIEESSKLGLIDLPKVNRLLRQRNEAEGIQINTEYETAELNGATIKLLTFCTKNEAAEVARLYFGHTPAEAKITIGILSKVNSLDLSRTDRINNIYVRTF